MKAIADPANCLGSGLAAIRAEFQVPSDFPSEVLAEAETVARRTPDAHRDRTGIPFVTLDPASSTDLDQAFAIERAGGDLLLHYAIADVAWFVDDKGVIDTEAWTRGTTVYLPDGKAGLHPPVLAEGAASLLPDGPRPAVIFTTRIAPDGSAKLEAAERAIVRSRAKLAYDSVRDEDLPPDFTDLAARVEAAGERRGARRVDPPEQEVARVAGGGFTLQFRPRLLSEDRNAALSLATNLAIADCLLAHRTGLFRVMAEPDEQAVAVLRHTAGALRIDWSAAETLDDLERRLDPSRASDAAMMMAVRRAGKGASYAPYREGVTPWHAAMAAPYVHATAPLRRLADRYVIRAALAVMNGKPVPESVTAAFEALPEVMARADARSGRIERAVIDLAESVMLSGREGEVFDAVIVDTTDRGARIQLRDLPIVARIGAGGYAPGAVLRVRLTAADPARRLLAFEVE